MAACGARGGPGARGRQVRRDNEEEYRQRLEAETDRLASGARAIEQLRELLRDVDGQMAHASADYLAAPGYPQDDEADEEDNFFLG